MDILFTVLAMAGGGTAEEQSPIYMFGPLFLMVLIFYFLLIRPQQRREKERREMINKVKTGDRVLFGGGLIGVVSNASDNTLTIKIADKVKVDVVRGAVTQVLGKGDDVPADVPQR